jgi:hypothetical protein
MFLVTLLVTLLPPAKAYETWASPRIVDLRRRGRDEVLRKFWLLDVDLVTKSVRLFCGEWLVPQ